MLFLFIPEKDLESNRGVSAPADEKAPGMAPSANEDGPVPAGLDGNDAV